MSLDPALVHPAILRRAGERLARTDLLPHERVYVDTLLALAASLRSPEEMLAATSVLNPLLDARAAAAFLRVRRIDKLAGRIRTAAIGARDAPSAMACEMCLDVLRLALDEARAELR